MSRKSRTLPSNGCRPLVIAFIVDAWRSWSESTLFRLVLAETLSFNKRRARQVRVHRGLSSRSKHRDAPQTTKVSAIRNGVSVELDVPLAKLPTLLPLPLF